MSIFVSIASYRDPELLPTIRDCLRKARWPQAIRFGICWQHTDDEALPPEFLDPRFRVIDVPWHESRGTCWARAEIMKLWDGEAFFLQIDSHHRFVPGWDQRLLGISEQSGAAKPLLTSYAAAFEPEAATPEAGEPMQMDLDHFAADGIPLFRPRVIPDWQTLRRPLRARFVSAHFLFTSGAFVEEVPYDPDLYFHGEEISLAVRAFTHGYTLLHPHEHVLWHEYTRSYRVKHWDDHQRSQGIAVEWHERDAASRRKVSAFLEAPHSGPFGCGSVRSFADYEAYSGLAFRSRTADAAALQGAEPPELVATTPRYDWEVRIVLPRSALPAHWLADSSFWYVGFHDGADREIYREDAHDSELCALLTAPGEDVVIVRRFRSPKMPASWTLWPYGRAAGWLDKVTHPISDDAITALSAVA